MEPSFASIPLCVPVVGCHGDVFDDFAAAAVVELDFAELACLVAGGETTETAVGMPCQNQRKVGSFDLVIVM